MIPIAFALGVSVLDVLTDESRDTEHILAAVVIDGDDRDTPLEVARLIRVSGRFWIERILGKREPFGLFDAAMRELDRIALAYNGRVSAR